MSTKTYFKLFTDNDTFFNMLSDEESGRLIKALFAFAKTGTEPDFEDDLALKMAYTFLSREIQRDFDTYEKRCEQNRKNILQRYTNEYDRKQDKDKDKDKDKGKDKDKDNSLSNPQGGLERGESEWEQILFSYHYFCQGLPRVSKLTEKRKKAVKKALPYLDEKGFEGLFEKVARSDFLMGKTGSWKADFDWLLKPDNLTRVLEGRYDNVEAPVMPSPRREPWQEERLPSYDIDALEAIDHLDEYAVES